MHIKKCFANQPAECHTIEEQLSTCPEMVDGMKVQETYTVQLSMPTLTSGDSANAKDADEAPEDE